MGDLPLNQPVLAYNPSMTSRMISLILAGSTLLLSPGTKAWAQDDLDVRVKATIQKGIDFLLDRQLIDGSWAGWAKGYECGVSPLILFTLLRSGLSTDHPAIERGLKFLGTKTPRNTYDGSSLLMALGATGDKTHSRWMKDVAEDLLEWMPDSGLYAYPNGAEDLSNSLFVALAFDIAAEQGIKIPSSVWRSLLSGTLLCLAEPRMVELPEGGRAVEQGFSYQEGASSCGSMSAAGITILEICRVRLGKRLSGGEQKALKKKQDGALLWLGNNFTLKHNPPARSWHYFHLWGYERVGSLLGVKTIGTHDWYREGAEYLIKNQKKAGNWYSEIDPAKFDPSLAQMAELRTCMALLFLRRSTLKRTSALAGTRVYRAKATIKDLVLRASGDTPLTLWTEKSELVVEAVEYFCRFPGREGQRLLLGKSKDHANGFAIRHEFDRTAKWEVWCEAESGSLRVKSDVLLVSIQGVKEPHLLEYASDSTRNLLARQDLVVTASSRAGDNVSGPSAFDNYLATFWECRKSDTDPWISVKLPRPVPVKKILLSPSRARRSDHGRARPKLVLVTLNGRNSYKVLFPDQDDVIKAVLELPRRKPVGSIKIEILEVYHGARGSSVVGLSEVEVVGR